MASPAHCPGIRENRAPAIRKFHDVVNLKISCLMLVATADNAAVLIPSLDPVAEV
jgi:hypothetical protein